MNDPSTLETLKSLEARYLGALVKVRGLIEMEGGTAEREPKTERPAVRVGIQRDQLLIAKRGVPRRNGSMKLFAHWRKGDAAEHVLKEIGPEMHKTALFEEMKRRGHPVSSPQSLLSMLSSDHRFVSVGNGLWRLAQPDLSSVNGNEKGATT